MIKSTTKKKVKKASSKKANPKSWIRHADLRPKGGSPDRTSSKDSEKIISNQEYYAKLHRLAEDIQWEKRNEYPIHGYPWHRALEDASEILAKKKQNPSKKCRVIKVRRKISMGKGKRPRILQVRRKVCNPEIKGHGFVHNTPISPKKRTEFLNDLNNLETKKVKLFSGKPLSESNLKSPELVISGILYETATDYRGRGFEVSGDLHEVYFDLDDIIIIKGKNIYLNNLSPDGVVWKKRLRF